MAKILVSIPDALLQETDPIVRSRYKNRSEFVREALRKACDDHYQNQKDRADQEPVEQPPEG